MAKENVRPRADSTAKKDRNVTDVVQETVSDVIEENLLGRVVRPGMQWAKENDPKTYYEMNSLWMNHETEMRSATGVVGWFFEIISSRLPLPKEIKALGEKAMGHLGAAFGRFFATNAPKADEFPPDFKHPSMIQAPEILIRLINHRHSNQPLPAIVGTAGAILGGTNPSALAAHLIQFPQRSLLIHRLLSLPQNQLTSAQTAVFGLENDGLTALVGMDDANFQEFFDVIYHHQTVPYQWALEAAWKHASSFVQVMEQGIGNVGSTWAAANTAHFNKRSRQDAERPSRLRRFLNRIF